MLVTQSVANYQPAAWPSASIVPLDLTAGDAVDEPAQRAVELGLDWPIRSRMRWRVLLDPAGHLFCITPFGASLD